MGDYESYAIQILDAAFGERFDRESDVVYSFGPDAGTGEVDGTVDGQIAVEIGVGSPKQIRGSILDLISHPLPGKLLVLVDSPGHSTERTVVQAATILARAGRSGVVYRLALEGDVGLIANELAQVVSKYLMETERSLHRVLAIATPAGATLVFENSDDLFRPEAPSVSRD